MGDGPGNYTPEAIRSKAAARKSPRVVVGYQEPQLEKPKGFVGHGVVLDDRGHQHRHDSFLEQRKANQAVVDNFPKPSSVKTVNEKLREQRKGRRSGVILEKQEDDAKRETMTKGGRAVLAAVGSLVLPFMFKKPAFEEPPKSGSGSGEVQGGTFVDTLEPSVPPVSEPAPPLAPAVETAATTKEILRTGFQYSSDVDVLAKIQGVKQ